MSATSLPDTRRGVLASFALCLWTLPRWRAVVAFGVLVAACAIFYLRPFEWRKETLAEYAVPVAKRGPPERAIDGAPDAKITGRYDGTALREWAAGYSERGLRYYVASQYQFDVIFPLIYGFAFALGIALPWEHARAKHASESKPRLWLLWLPTLAVVFDFAENITVISLLNDLPSKGVSPSWEACANAAGWFTWLKWRFCLASLVAVAVGLAWAYRPTWTEVRS